LIDNEWLLVTKSNYGGKVTVPKTPLTRDEHLALGQELYQIRDRLSDIGMDLMARYGKSTRVGRPALKLLTALETIRCQLDSQALDDLGPDEWSPRIYYPGKLDHEQQPNELVD
jgi:hypothetical protein